jgi:hypothetical protein
MNKEELKSVKCRVNGKEDMSRAYGFNKEIS